ncbi:hypothetical protein GBF38_012257, partial [Nibea albiflora]
ENTGTSTEDSSEEEEEEEEDEEGSDNEEEEAEEYHDGTTRVSIKYKNLPEELLLFVVCIYTAMSACCHGFSGNSLDYSHDLVLMAAMLHDYATKCRSLAAFLEHRSRGNELVTPRRIRKGRLQVQLEGEGTYECSLTGLVFEASERVLVRYSVLSWSKFGAFLRDSWKFAGPIFNVDTVDKEASVLKSIQFPHSVCLADPENEMTFSVLHIKDNRPLIEPTVDHSGSHVKWNVTSLSPVGPIIQTTQSVEHHGVVLVYKQLGSDENNYSFHIYLATNSASDITDVAKQVRGYKKRYIQIEKPPTCKLDEGTYRLMSEPEGDIKPEDLKFTLAVTKMKGYFEAFFEQPPPFKLSLRDTNTDETVWSATIREGNSEFRLTLSMLGDLQVKVSRLKVFSSHGLSCAYCTADGNRKRFYLSGDCVNNVEKKPRKRTSSRQRSSSPSEEETACKRPRWQDESDGVKTVMTQDRDMSEKQLLQVAKRLGKEWKQVAIYLDLNSRELDEIQQTEKDVTMQKLKMLVEWKSRRRTGQATAYHLWKSVEELDDLPNEVHQTLKG